MIKPVLDPDFVPAVLWNREYKAKVDASGMAVDVAIALLRPDKTCSVFNTRILPKKPENEPLTLRYLERTLKFLLWQRGGSNVLVAGCDPITEKLSVIYYLKDNREVHLEADRGTLQTATNDIEFFGNVVIRNDEYRMKTEHLSYEHEKRFIFCNEPVRIWGEGSELTAQSATYDLNADKIVLKGNVIATISRDFAAIPGRVER